MRIIINQNVRACKPLTGAEIPSAPCRLRRLSSTTVPALPRHFLCMQATLFSRFSRQASDAPPAQWAQVHLRTVPLSLRYVPAGLLAELRPSALQRFLARPRDLALAGDGILSFKGRSGVDECRRCSVPLELLLPRSVRVVAESMRCASRCTHEYRPHRPRNCAHHRQLAWLTLCAA